MPELSVGDLRVFYREWTSARETGRPVVMVHGNWSSHLWWAPMGEALEMRLPGHRLLAPDSRGRGQTQGPPHGFTIPEIAADLRDFLDALELPRVHLVGHSLGTAAVLELALHHPQRVASLVAVAPVWVDGMPPEYDDPEGYQKQQEDRVKLEAALRNVAPGVARDERWEELVDVAQRQRTEATIGALAALLQWTPGDELRRLSMPRVVVVGERDPLCGGPNGVRAAEAMDCERIELPGVGHSPNLEVPQPVAEIVARVVREGEAALRGED